MKKFVFALFVLAGLGIAHALILENAEILAQEYAIPYEEISDEEAYRQLLAGPNGWLYNDAPSKISIQLVKSGLYYKHHAAHVAPIQEKIESAANVAFSVMYVILSLLLARAFLAWMRAGGAKLIARGFRKLGYFCSGWFGQLGLKNLFLNHRLKLTEKEFLRVKTLFDNGLITEEEFKSKKAAIRRKISSDNLLNKV